jgi:hypothetical protein
MHIPTERLHHLLKKPAINLPHMGGALQGDYLVFSSLLWITAGKLWINYPNWGKPRFLANPFIKVNPHIWGHNQQLTHIPFSWLRARKSTDFTSIHPQAGSG